MLATVNLSDEQIKGLSNVARKGFMDLLEGSKNPVDRDTYLRLETAFQAEKQRLTDDYYASLLE